MEQPRPRAFRPSPALPLAALLLCHVLMVAADAQAVFPVSARVTPVARIETLGAPTGFAVSPADAQRGYVTVEQPVRVRIYSNSREGYQLDVRNLAGTLPGLSLSGLGQDIDLPGEGGTIVQRWDSAKFASLTLRFSFRLPQGLPPGTYPWPVQLGVRPL